MATYKTPGVYVKEIATLPPSIAEVGTAIPAFIGFTQMGDQKVPLRITSLIEYQISFGGADGEKNIVANVVNTDEGTKVNVSINPDNTSKNVMYYALKLYFENRGGPCYIMSAGKFDDTGNALEAYKRALNDIAIEDEPTLLVFPDAPLKLNANDYYNLMNLALQQCSKLGDRFAIIDVVDQGGARPSAELFRSKLGVDPDLGKYGAAYYPYLKSNIKFEYDEKNVSVNLPGDAPPPKPQDEPTPSGVTTTEGGDGGGGGGRRAASKSADGGTAAPPASVGTAAATRNMAALKTTDNALLNKIRQKIEEQGVLLPASAAIAGVYASVDSTRGVWKAPANVTLNSVIGPAVRVTDDDQNNLNVDETAGKSINAIRAFVGQGTKIWGARTLSGNDNEWRYINVRRFFNMVEESVKKSTNWAVFEGNDAGTWTRVRTMIENYLLVKWREGALAGAKADDAFFVRVGLGQTMTPQDILEGIMRVEIGMAVVRPAEFIILNFSHKLQNS